MSTLHAFVLGIAVWSASSAAGDELAAAFLSPPDSAKPWAYWWWLNGHVSREGITADLEAMKRRGINGVLIFNAGGGATPPGLTFMGSEWVAAYKHALDEAGRLGMDVSVNLCDGWDAGGPWITPECANKRLVHAEAQVDGPGRVVLPLPRPEALDGFYRDVAVAALPVAARSPLTPLRIAASAELGGYCDEKNWPCAAAADRDPETVWRTGRGAAERWIMFEYAEPLRACAVHIAAAGAEKPVRCRVEASDDGRRFRSIAEFQLETPAREAAFAPAAARFFRLAFAAAAGDTGIEECRWIWFPEGDPARSAPPGVVRFRRTFTVPADARIARAVFTATADNAFTLHVNGNRAGGNAGDPEGFHALNAIDVARWLAPGDNVLAVTAENASDTANPAGFIGRLDAALDGGRRVVLVTDGSWKASRDPAPEEWLAAGFDDRAWPAALNAAPYGGGPWGRPSLSVADLQVAEVWFLREGDAPQLRPGIKWHAFKSANRSFWDWPKEGPAVLHDEYGGPETLDARAAEVLDLSDRMRPDGTLEWDVPAGRWAVLRFGYTLQGQRTRAGSTAGGYEADMLDAAGIERHFENLAAPLLDAAGESAGRTLKFLHVDSYELGADVRGRQPTWSADFRGQFARRRGYDLLPYLPAMAGYVLDGRETTARFFEDFRRTIGDLMAEEFFDRFAALAHARGVGIHCETGYGTYPHPHFDGLRCAGACDITMGEFWHGTDIMSQFDPFCNVIRSVASAAHVYGRRIVQAEAFTSWDHFIEHPFGLKALGDAAFCDGLNRMVFHQYTHQPCDDVVPGWQYGAGTHIDRHVTWWPLAGAWFTYLARCQHLLQAGRFHADVCYFYGEGATKYAPGRAHLQPALPAGYDADVVNADVLQARMTAKDGRLALPEGPSYRLLVLPETPVMSPAVLRRIEKLIEAGATVTGPRPLRSHGLGGYPRCDADLRAIADRLWGAAPDAQGDRRIGKGRLLWGRPLAEICAALGLAPDFEARTDAPDARLDFIHRTIDGADVYFVSNQRQAPVRAECVFRVAGKRPELWDPVSGKIDRRPASRPAPGGTIVPLAFAPAQSFFVVFRPAPPAGEVADSHRVVIDPTPVAELPGPWEVAFDPRWGGPERATFEKLADWTAHALDGIKHYSGRAVYRLTFDRPAAAAPSARLYLDLGDVRNVARVSLNGQDLGIVWCAPWRVDITNAIAPAGNRLEIEVANVWANRLIGDARLPPEKRLARTNVAFRSDHPLLPSGLLGPVTIRADEND